MTRVALLAASLIALPTSVPAHADDSGPVPNVLTNSIGMKFAVIPAGEFTMGPLTKEQDPDAQASKALQHRVRVSFQLGVTEVTVGQFRRFIEATGHKMKADRGHTWSDPMFDQTEQHPVVIVNWYDCVTFCNWLSRSEGRKEFYTIKGEAVTVADWKANGYRLPTEAECEYAYRAGTVTRFCCADQELARYAWYKANSGGRTHPVGEKLPNKFGLFDMHGNVMEWCWDFWLYRDHPETKDVVTTDPHGPDPTPYRVDRGGSWQLPPDHLESAISNGDPPRGRTDWVGFRIARNQLGNESK